MAARGGTRPGEGPEVPPPQSLSEAAGADVVRPKVSIAVMRAALAAAGVPTAGLLERAELEALYWRLQEGEASTSEAAAAAFPAPRETVLGNCALCGSGDKLKFCSRCNAVRYCGPACQKDDVRRGQRNKSLNPLSRRVFSSFLSGYMTFNLHINIGRSAGQVNPYAPTRLQRPSPGKGPSPSSDADGPLLL